jgi:type II secretory pathway component PulM
VLAWLAELAAQGVAVESLGLGPGAGPGLVNARATARE